MKEPTSSQGITSRPYKPLRCCELCVFGTGYHADWCEKQIAFEKEHGDFDLGSVGV